MTWQNEHNNRMSNFPGVCSPHDVSW